MNLDGALQTFFAEAEELLTSLESALLRVDEGAHDAETLNEIFRAAHTIKGSAGLFGLLIEFIALRPLRNRKHHHLAPMIATIACATMIISPAALLTVITRPGIRPRRRRGPMPMAVSRNPQTMASVVSSRWNAATSRL